MSNPIKVGVVVVVIVVVFVKEIFDLKTILKKYCDEKNSGPKKFKVQKIKIKKNFGSKNILGINSILTQIFFGSNTFRSNVPWTRILFGSKLC